jgi:hypothetical protein
VRLADFILANVEPILLEWESFARTIWPNGTTADPAEVRDEAEDILHATAVDMQSDQTGRTAGREIQRRKPRVGRGCWLNAGIGNPREWPGGVGLRVVGGNC